MQKIADSIVGELDPIYQEELDNMTTKKLEESTGDRIKDQAILLAGLSLALRNHAERFTTRMIQEVVNQLDSKS